MCECERAPARARGHAGGRCPRAPFPPAASRACSAGRKGALPGLTSFLPVLRAAASAAPPVRGPRRPLGVTFTLMGKAGSGGSRWRGGTPAATYAPGLPIPTRDAALGWVPAFGRPPALFGGRAVWGRQREGRAFLDGVYFCAFSERL